MLQLDCKFHLQPILFCQLAVCNGNNSMQDEFWHAACYHSWWFRHQSSAGCAFTLVKRGGNHKPLACKYKNKKVLQYFTVQLWKSGESIHNLLIRTYIFLVYTKTVDSVFRALWLATQSVNILHYSLIHLQFLRVSDAKRAQVASKMPSRFATVTN